MPSKKVPVSLRVIDDYQTATDNVQQPPSMNQVTPDHLYQWYWKMPEMRGIASTIISDIFGEGYEFEGSDARVKKVWNFCKSNRFSRNLKAVLRDYIVTGNGYLGKAALTESQILNLMDEYWVQTFQKGANTIQKVEFISMAKQAKPDLYSPQVLFPLMARSIKIQYDKHGQVTGYAQFPKTQSAFATTNDPNPDDPQTYTTGTMGANGGLPKITFSPEEVIHFAYEPIGDQIYGTSPFQSAIYDIVALWYAKNYGGLFFQNDATPSYLFKMPDESPDSENYKRFNEQLKKHRQNPHRNMVMTGNIETERLNPLGKDLEFGAFMDKYTQRILMSFGATARFSHLFTGRLETPANLEGYYKGINSIQTELEEQLNMELFDHFDVEFQFKRVYKRDESREADIVTKLANLAITVNEAREYLGYKPMEGEQFNVLQPGMSASQTPPTQMNDVSAADARSEQTVENTTAPYQPKGDKPVNNKE